MAEVDHVQINQFAGLNISRPKDQIEDNEFEILQNVVHRKGALQKRNGLVLKQNVVDLNKLDFVGMCQSDQPFIVDMYFIDRANTNLYSTNKYVSALSDMVLVHNNAGDILSNLWGTGAGAYCIYKTAVTDDVSLVRLRPLATGVELQFVSTDMQDENVKHSWVFEHQDRIWVILTSHIIGSDFDGTVIGFSEPGDYTTVSTFNTEEKTIRIPDTTIIEAQPLGDKVILFGRTGGIWVLNTQGSPRNWSLRQLNKEINLPLARTSGNSFSSDKRYGYQQATLKYKDLIYFVAMDGFYVTDGVNLKKLSEKVQDYFGYPNTFQYIGTLSDGNWLTELPGVSIFNDLQDELIIKTVYDINFAPKYLIYNIELDLWSEFVVGLNPAGLIVTTDWINATDVDSRPYPYTFAGMGYAMKHNLVGTADIISGFHLFSNVLAGEQNKVYAVRSNAQVEKDEVYYDGPSGSPLPYTTRIKTKSFDFGYRGINKKCVKNYMTIRTLSATDITNRIKRYVNDVVMSDVDVISDSTKKHHKFQGPGYFIEYSLEISDVTNMQFWEIQSVSFDLIKKPEQLTTTGVSP